MDAKEEVKKHIHGCGHPVRPVVLCDDPACTCIGMLTYMDWAEYHEGLQENGKCKAKCYFCYTEEKAK